MAGIKLLLIDDDEDDQFIFADALKQIAPEVECTMVSTAADALRMLEDQILPCIIFLDLNMPLMNGIEFLLTVKKHSRTGSIPVIIYSTSDNPADKKLVKKLGAVQFITKTSDFKTLKAILGQILTDTIRLN